MINIAVAIEIVACICITACVMALVYKVIKSDKGKPVSSDELVKYMDYIDYLANSFIVLADDFEDYTGEQKMQFVVTRIYDIISNIDSAIKVDKQTIQAVAQAAYNNMTVVVTTSE